jgi:hypothetical protein
VEISAARRTHEALMRAQKFNGAMRRMSRTRDMLPALGIDSQLT